MVRAQEIVRANGEVVRRKPREGDMRWDGKVWRRWSGRRWATAAYAMRPERLRVRDRLDLDPEVSHEKAARFLALAVEDQVATNGASIVLEGSKGVILGYGRRAPLAGHALLTVLTIGLWTPVLIAASLSRREDRVRLTVDAWGNVWATPVASP